MRGKKRTHFYRVKNSSRKKKLTSADERKCDMVEQVPETICVDFPDNEILFENIVDPDQDSVPILETSYEQTPDDMPPFNNLFEEQDCIFWELPSLHELPASVNGNSTEKVDSDGMFGDEFYVVLDHVYMYDPEINLEEFVTNKAKVNYLSLKKECQLLFNVCLSFQMVQSSQYIRYVELYDTETPSVKTCITIKDNFRADIIVHGEHLPSSHQFWHTHDLPTKFITTAQIKTLIDTVTCYNICIGNPEPVFQDKLPQGYYSNHPTPNSAGYREGDFGANFKGFHYSSTIRSSKCSLLSTAERCKDCQVYRCTLRKRGIRLKDKVPTPEKNWLTSRKGNSTMTESEKLSKLKQMTAHSADLKSKIKALEKKARQAIQNSGVILQDTDSQDFSNLMNNLTTEIKQQFPEQTSYQRLFWEQQLKFNKLNDKRGMRWHPMMIKWCLYLKRKSSTSYDALRNSGFINLPSERLLYDYSHVIRPGVGYNPDVLLALKTEIEQRNLNEEWQKYVGILQDEIKIKEDLVYDKHTGELVGFVNLDQIGNDICHIEESIKNETSKLAKSVLVIMVRGITNNLKFPFAHFATTGVTSDQLFPILWQAVEILEVDMDLKVLFITADGASPNRRFIRLHAVDEDGQNGIVYKAFNRFADDNRYIYFISDPPHLIKTTRNCMSNSYSHKKTRRLWKDGKDISWLHIVDLFKDHCTGGLRLCNKLTRNHIDISSFGCMKVSLAAQVLSSTVANALEFVYGPETTETVTFIRHMNKFFDCLNARSLFEGRNSRNENVAPYTSEDDPRLDYLLNDFLTYFRNWKTSVENRPGQFSKSDKSRMQLSYQTLQGFEITIKSVVECVKLLLQKGAPYVLTEHFNQDPIEQHFGIVRTGGGCNNNPNLQQFNHSILNARVAGSQALAPFKGNTRRNIQRDFNLECQPLPKRKRPSL